MCVLDLKHEKWLITRITEHNDDEVNLILMVFRFDCLIKLLLDLPLVVVAESQS